MRPVHCKRFIHSILDWVFVWYHKEILCNKRTPICDLKQYRYFTYSRNHLEHSSYDCHSAVAYPTKTKDTSVSSLFVQKLCFSWLERDFSKSFFCQVSFFLGLTSRNSFDFNEFHIFLYTKIKTTSPLTVIY